MKGTTAWILVIAAVAMMILSVAAAPLSADPKDKAPLSLAVEPSATPVAPGGFAIVRVRVKNESPKSLQVRLQRLTRLGLLHGQPLRIEVRNEKRRPVDIMTLKIQAIPPPIVNRSLKPQEEAVLEFELFHLLVMSTPAGKYSLQAHYRTNEFTVSSETASIVVRSPSVDDRKALQLYLAAAHLPDDKAAVDALRKILKDYPNTSVTDRIREELADRLLSAGKAREAIAVWRVMLGIRSTYRDTVRWKLAGQLAKTGRLEQAIKTLQPAKGDVAQTECEKWKARLGTRKGAAQPATQPALRPAQGQ